MARRWNGDDFAGAGVRAPDGAALLPLAEDRLTSLTSRNKFLAVPVTRGGGVVARRTLPGRSRLERSASSLTSPSLVEPCGMDSHLRSDSRPSGWLFLKSKLCCGIGIRFPPALELAGGGKVYLLVDSGCPRPGSHHDRRGHFGQSREGVLDERVGQGEMELADRLQALEPPRQSVRQIPKQRVDELLQVVTLIGADSDEVVENLVVASGVKLLSQASKAF